MVVSHSDCVQRSDYNGACQTIAAMHAAAVGEVRGPILGVVEDVTDLRARFLAAEEALSNSSDMQQFWNECEKWLKEWRDRWIIPGTSRPRPEHKNQWEAMNQVLDEMREKAACGMLPWAPWPDDED